VLAVESQSLARGDQKRRRRYGASERRQRCRKRGQQMLCVVDDEQRPATRQSGGECLLECRPGIGLGTHRVRHRRQGEGGVAHGCEWGPVGAVGERVRGLGRCLERESCLAGAAGAGESKKADVGLCEQGCDRVELLPPAEEGRGGNGKIRAVERLERRKLCGEPVDP
jgi:hypothetical protein